MSTRKHLGQSRTFRPSAESLEGRQLLSGTVSGVDTAGDQWTLTLSGHGTIQVIKQNDSTGSPASLTSNTEIKSIVIAGTDPSDSKLIGTVKPGAGSDGRVFFENLTERPNRSEKLGLGLGPLSINMPDFYLGVTDPTTPSGVTQPRAEINIPDGVNTLRFGGVDTTAFFGTDPTQSLAQDGQNDQILIRLGIPESSGTNLIVNKITSSSQAAAASTSGSANSPTQKSVVIQVGGRLNLFEANEIDGSTTNANTSTSFDGGTIVASLPDPSTQITGQIGFIRVGGNATNFAVVTNANISNYYVGGETNNNAILAGGGMRDVFFGKGADTTTIYSHTIHSLQANRGITNSTILSERMIGNLVSGGDVSNSVILSGYAANLAGVAAGISTTEANNGTFFQQAVTFPTPTAEAGGNIVTYIAGSISNSVFAASDNPITQPATGSPLTNTSFGDPQDAFLPLGQITARLQGTVTNTTATPNMPTTAFYGKVVNLTHGVVVPPTVVEPPLPAPPTPVTVHGIPAVFPANNKGVTTTKRSHVKSTVGALLPVFKG